MATNKRTMQATPRQVWEVLADGWLYPLWVVGASRMREVDAGWPSVGSTLHHSVGVWPLLVDDTTKVVDVVPDSELTLHARAWPIGTAKVVIGLHPIGDSTEVRITEDAIAGPGRVVPAALRNPPLTWRNVETLRRLAFLAERRQAR